LPNSGFPGEGVRFSFSLLSDECHMSDRTNMNRQRRHGLAVALAGCLAWLAAGAAGAAPPAKDKDKTRTAVGRCVSTVGVLLERENPDKEWKPVKPRSTVSSRDMLMALPGSRADIRTKSGAVRLTLAGNLPELAVVPLFESAVVLHAGKDYDLDFTVDRGRVHVTNTKPKGAVTVRVRFGDDESWAVTLKSRGAEVALEYFGRWLQTPTSIPKIDKKDRPDFTLLLFVLKGEVELKEDANSYTMRAPPGPALFAWTSRRGPEGPLTMKQLPPWATAKVLDSPQAKAAKVRVERLRKEMEKKPLTSVLEDELKSDQPARRGLAVFSLAALDEIPDLLNALENKQHHDVRLEAIDALRHWMGRGRDTIGDLFYHLRDKKKFSPAHATITIQLLHSFSQRQLSRPETYSLLIAYLTHPRLAIRELADWHLRRLVSEGPKYKYDPAGSEQQLKKAQAEWKKIIPEGQLPKRPKPKK
jgi:hypothetical protein